MPIVAPTTARSLATALGGWTPIPLVDSSPGGFLRPRYAVYSPLLTSAFLLGILVACHDAPTAPPPPCQPYMVITVEPGPPARFAWTPNCRVRGFSIMYNDTLGPLARNTTVWGFDMPRGQYVRSGVVYGVAPRGAVIGGLTPVPDSPFLPGRHYTLLLWGERWDDTWTPEMVGITNYYP